MPRAKPTIRQTISDQFRQMIRNQGITAYTLGRETGIDAAVIQRFLNHERTITLATLDRLAEALGLRLAETGRRPARPVARSKVRRSSPPKPTVVAGEPMGGDGAAEGV